MGLAMNFSMLIVSGLMENRDPSIHCDGLLVRSDQPSVAPVGPHSAGRPGNSGLYPLMGQRGSPGLRRFAATANISRRTVVDRSAHPRFQAERRLPAPGSARPPYPTGSAADVQHCKRDAIRSCPAAVRDHGGRPSAGPPMRGRITSMDVNTTETRRSCRSSFGPDPARSRDDIATASPPATAQRDIVPSRVISGPPAWRKLPHSAQARSRT